MKNLFNASFEDSKYLIHKRRWILLPGGDSDTKRIGESLLNGAAFWPTLAAMILFPMLTYITYPKNIRVWMASLDFILFMWTIFMADIYPKFHHKNWAEMHKRMVPSMLGFGLSGLIVTFGIVKDIWVRNTGIISIIFQGILLVTCTLTSVYYFILLPLRQINEGTLGLKEKNKTLIIMLTVNLILLLLSFCSGTIHYLTHFKFEGEMFIMGFILPFIILAEIIGGFVMFKSYLSYHYIAKYPRQYRLYYKIPDSIWYFSKEEAEKRNDPVYPPRKKSVEEE